MRRLVKALFLTSMALALLGGAGGAYWYWRAGGPGGMAQEAGEAANQALVQWGREHPELAASLRKHLAEATGRPDADLTDLHRGIDAWLQENASELAEWQDLTLTEDEDDLVRVLELRRGLTRRLAENATGNEAGPDPAPASSERILEISEGHDGPHPGLETPHIEPGLEFIPGGSP
jgi:hypothetical protein